MQVHRNGGLGRKFFLFVSFQCAAHEVAEAAVVAALDGKFVAVGVVDLFNTAGRGAKHPQRQVRLFCRLLAQQGRKARRRPCHLDLLCACKANDAQPAEGRVQAQLAVGDFLLKKGIVVLRGGKVQHRVIGVGGLDDGKTGVFGPAAPAHHLRDEAEHGLIRPEALGEQERVDAEDAHEKLLARFADHEYDIMVGTQMVAKGLDFEDVTLVGVLGIDSLLFAQGFRAYENVFSLITQVVGRSGRAKEPGFAIIQTTDPDNPVLTLAAAQDYDAFYEQEIAYRKLGLYPPFCGLCVIGFAGAKENEVARAAARFSALLGQQAAKQPDLPLRILGPTPGSIEKINDTYRYKLTVKCRNDRRFRDLVRSTLALYEKEKLPSRASVVVDLHSDGDI